MEQLDKCKERLYLITKNNVSKIIRVQLTSDAYLARADEADIEAMTLHTQNYTTTGEEDAITIEELDLKYKNEIPENQLPNAIKINSDTYAVKSGTPLLFISKFRTINHNTLVYMCYDKLNSDIVLLPSLNAIFYIESARPDEFTVVGGVTVGYGSNESTPLSTIVNSKENKLPVPELNKLTDVDVNLVAMNNVGKGAFLGSNITFEKMINNDVNLTGQNTAPITMVKLGNLKDIFVDKKALVPVAVLGQFNFRNTSKTNIHIIPTENKEGPLYLVCKL
ncbi:hypothetical protein ACVWU4_001009 [Campylobacter coli]